MPLYFGFFKKNKTLKPKLELYFSCTCGILGKNYFLTFTVCTSSNIKDLWPGGSRTSGTVASITNFLGNSFADSDGELFMDRMTFLSWHLVTLLQRLVPADLVRNVSADLSRNISA